MPRLDGHAVTVTFGEDAAFDPIYRRVWLSSTRLGHSTTANIVCQPSKVSHLACLGGNGCHGHTDAVRATLFMATHPTACSGATFCMSA
ncbi:MAG: hypothetical protein R3E65_08220 [Steroidobacteraceae bacterium]